MTTALVSKQFIATFGDAFKAAGRTGNKSVEFMTLPEEKGARLSQSDCDRVDCVFIDRDLRFSEQLYTACIDAALASKSIKWLHSASSGAWQQKFMHPLADRDVTITSSIGSNAEPVAQTGFAGLLMLARGFWGFAQGQHKHEWQPMRGKGLPPDLRGQTLLLIGVGAIGKVFAGYARAFGLKVIGVRRSPMQAGDPVDEMHPPSKLPELWPRADWVVIACPLTKETRNLVNARRIQADEERRLCY